MRRVYMIRNFNEQLGDGVFNTYAVRETFNVSDELASAMEDAGAIAPFNPSQGAAPQAAAAAEQSAGETPLDTGSEDGPVGTDDSDDEAPAVRPDDASELERQIMVATGQLDVDNSEHFTKPLGKPKSKPKVPALETVLGYQITGGERDSAWAALLGAAPEDPEDDTEDEPGAD